MSGNPSNTPSDSGDAVPSMTTTSDTPTTSSDPPSTTTSSSESPPPPPPSSTTTSKTPTPTPTTTPTPSSTTTPSTTSTTESTTSTPPPSTSTTSSTPPTESSTSSEPSSTETSSSSPIPSSTSSVPPPSSSTPAPGESDPIETTTVTSYTTQTLGTHTSTSSPGSPTLTTGSDKQQGSLDQSKKIAIAVVVPIAGVALLVLAALFFWRRRKQRKDAEEERRKEVEDYAYNPNNDPTVPNVGTAAGAFEMKEDATSGYRGWGSTTLASSTGRKASTTLSGGGAGEPLMSDGSHSPEGEILGAMGPSSAENRGANVHRGPSNASSSYSAAGRSDGSGENGTYGGAAYYDQYGAGNPYSDPYSDSPNGQVQPVIRDNPARRNTRIENPSPYAQQSAGISQNF